VDENLLDEVLGGLEEQPGPVGDRYHAAAVAGLTELFEANRQRVFFSRQLEVMHEAQWFHWVTNRAIHRLVEEGLLRSEDRTLASRGRVTLRWHKAHRYNKRDAARLISLIEDYANPNIGAALGLQGEFMILEALARQRLVLYRREAREFKGRVWEATRHDLDFIFEDGQSAFGVEVKNTLGYMSHEELTYKLSICRYLGLRPVFAVRMLPKTWVWEINRAGGYALIFKYQLYPWTHRELAKRVREELELPVDAPRALMQGTLDRFQSWRNREGV
jgi:hypothetical protein